MILISTYRKLYRAKVDWTRHRASSHSCLCYKPMIFIISFIPQAPFYPKSGTWKSDWGFFEKWRWVLVLCALVWWYSTGKLELFRHMDVASVWPRKGEAFKPNTTQLPQLNIRLRASCVGPKESCLGAWCHENIKLCWNFEGWHADNCS